jgi:hypothetical protein
MEKWIYLEVSDRFYEFYYGHRNEEADETNMKQGGLIFHDGC